MIIVIFRYLYWTDWGRKPGIERISMDGDLTTRSQIISTDIIWPNGLTLDYAQNKIYWTDSKLKRLEVANMDGTGRVLLTSSKIDSPFALVDFEDVLYWTDWNTNRIMMTNKFNSPGDVKPFSANHNTPMGIKVYHPLKQPRGKALTVGDGNSHFVYMTSWTVSLMYSRELIALDCFAKLLSSLEVSVFLAGCLQY